MYMFDFVTGGGKGAGGMYVIQQSEMFNTEADI